MPRVRFEPSGVRVETEAGRTLLQVAIAAGVEVEAVCGGRGTCGKCRVIASGALSAPNAAELAKLSAEERARGYRLACQAVVEGDAQVDVPDESRISRVSILSTGAGGEVALDPWVRRVRVRVPEPSLDDQRADLDRLRAALGQAGLADADLAPSALRALPGALRAAGGDVTLVSVGERVADVFAAEGPARLLGLAVDIGTTTVVGYLLDLETGEQVGVASRLNPQTRYGDDVVSRIGHAQEPGGLEALQHEVVGALNSILGDCCNAAGASIRDVYAITVVGNTTMTHLFLGVNPEALARSPYVPAFTSTDGVSAADLGLTAHPEAWVHVLPNIAGWVGADTMGVLLATRLHEHDAPALAIDIGTNGEMALGSRHRLVTCSTAAGPAFEGAHLSCGMRAADGAIDAVNINHRVEYHVIGEAPARGVCGSGLVDLVAGMLDTGIIDAAGVMQDAGALREAGYDALSERLTQEGRHRAFVLVPPQEGAAGRPVVVTQRDVRELQLAKGAIRAGVEILMRELGITVEDVRHVYLAGAFGNYIKPASALAIGLIPHFPNAEIVPVGNAAGSGARMALLSRASLREARALLGHVEYLELSCRADFTEQFAEAMVF